MTQKNPNALTPRSQALGFVKLLDKCEVINMLEFDIGFVPETPEEKEEFAKQEVANSMDVTPGLAKECHGKTWRQIFKMLRYYD